MLPFVRLKSVAMLMEFRLRGRRCWCSGACVRAAAAVSGWWHILGAAMRRSGRGNVVHAGGTGQCLQLSDIGGNGGQGMTIGLMVPGRQKLDGGGVVSGPVAM
jgi:hypothetical protein